MRRDDRSVTRPCGFFVDHSADAEVDWDATCECPELSYQRNLLMCRECGTVYAVAQMQTFRSGWTKLAWSVAL